VQDAVKNLAKDIEALKELNKNQLPSELKEVNGQGSNDADEEDGLQAPSMGDNEPMLAHVGWPVAQMPQEQVVPMERALLPAGSVRMVGTLSMGTTVFQVPTKNNRHGNRGKDKRKRKDRKCNLCGEIDCPGKWNRVKCTGDRDYLCV